MSVVISTMLTFVLGIAMPTVGFAQQEAALSHYEDGSGDHWLIGCVTDDLANRLIAHGGFNSGSGPLGILCVEGYTPVSKQLDG